METKHFPLCHFIIANLYLWMCKKVRFALSAASGASSLLFHSYVNMKYRHNYFTWSQNLRILGYNCSRNGAWLLQPWGVCLALYRILPVTPTYAARTPYQSASRHWGCVVSATLTNWLAERGGREPEKINELCLTLNVFKPACMMARGDLACLVQ